MNPPSPPIPSSPPAESTSTERVIGVVFTVLGLAAAAEALTFDVAFITDPIGPKALPLVASLGFLGVGLNMVARPRPIQLLPSTGALRRATAAFGLFLAYSLALPWLGFLASTVFVLVGLGSLFGGSFRYTIPAGLVVAGALWSVFFLLLGLPLPVGELWIR